MNEEIRKAVVDALHAATGVLNDPVAGRTLLAGEDFRFASLEMDSLTLFEMMMNIEEALGLELDADEVAEHETLSALVAWLDSRRAVPAA